MLELNHTGTLNLETDRLILRPFKVEDAEDMFTNWASNKNVTKFLTWPTHESVDGTRWLLEMWAKEYENIKTYHWAVVLKETMQAIGDISIVRMDEQIGAAELGWCLSEDYWGNGIMPEAALAVRDFLFDTVGFLRIAAIHDKNNPKSGRVMKKIGMQYEGTERKAGLNNQGICDVVIYAILKEDR